MIVLDTHIWIWWVQGDPLLEEHHALAIRRNEAGGLGISAISLWEVAMIAQKGRLDFGRPVADWIALALRYPGMTLLPLSPDVAVESCHLPGELHGDPADRMIIATARVHQCPLLTADRKILAFPHVELV